MTSKKNNQQIPHSTVSDFKDTTAPCFFAFGEKERKMHRSQIKLNDTRSYSIVARVIPVTGRKSFGNSVTSTPKTSFGRGGILRGKDTPSNRVLTLSQLLGRIQKLRQQKVEQQKRHRPIKPIIPPKSLLIILKEKPEKIIYNRRIIDYKHCGLLQRYIGLGGKILPRRQTRLSSKQQRYIAKTIKSARIMGLLPFVSKEKGYFR